MCKAGFFRLRGVLVGTLAYQAYAGPLGIRLSGHPLMTQDADFAQFWGISENIGESMPPVPEVLRGVDRSFEQIPALNDPFVSAVYRNSRSYRVDILTPNRGSEEHQSRLARMQALGGSGAQPLRHLDYLIQNPERSVFLYRGGIPVSIPRAERFAVHKLIVAAERHDQIKSVKDVTQASALLEALAVRRPLELAQAWTNAWERGPRWREKLERGRARLNPEHDSLLQDVLGKESASRKRRGKNT